MQLGEEIRVPTAYYLLLDTMIIYAATAIGHSDRRRTSAGHLAQGGIQTYTDPVRFKWDGHKSERNLQDRGFDFEFATQIFDGFTLEREDTRRDYGERRVIAVGMAQDIALTVVYTDRAEAGGENVNSEVDGLFDVKPLRRILAQVEVSYSNSLIEAWWRSLRHQLKHHRRPLPDGPLTHISFRDDRGERGVLAGHLY